MREPSSRELDSPPGPMARDARLGTGAVVRYTRPHGMSSDFIRLRGLLVDCIVGILPEERRREQPVELEVKVELDLTQAATHGRITTTCDYDRLADEIAALLRFRRYRLLEMAAEEISAMILGVHASVSQVQLEICKPRALQGRARAASVGVTRDRSRYPRRQEQTAFGRAEILLENCEAGLYLLHVAQGREIPAHRHEVMRELEWLIAGALERDGRRLHGFEPIVWRHGQVHSYRNVGDGPAVLFCCDVPAFDRADEIEVLLQPAAESERTS
ncbi:MAG: FolB domain-containing protein [Myxococcales bacterium FL481]|nr:MAG: FolB domain-containing protein [Myxococcales bacterium FL481]